MIQTAAIPASHRDLIEGPYWVALTTVMPDGQPQTTPVWCGRAGEYILTNTMRGFQKEKNMRANPRVSLLVYDPHNPLRNIEIEGRVIELTEVGAVEHNDLLTQLYTGKAGARFFGDAIPAELAADYHPVKISIAPTRIQVDGADKKSDTIPALKVSNEVAPTSAIPESHQDLLLRPVYGVLSTLLPDGQPQSSLVWVDYNGAEVLINIALEQQECQNLCINPKVTLLVVDPQDTSRYIEVRGKMAEITLEGALAHTDMLIRRYGKPYLPHHETRAIVKVRPCKLTLDAFFNSGGRDRLKKSASVS